MRIIFFLIASLISIPIFAQPKMTEQGNTNTHVTWMGEYAFGGSIKIPKVCGVPSAPTGKLGGLNGLVVYDSCGKVLYIHNGTIWVAQSGGGGASFDSTSTYQRLEQKESQLVSAQGRQEVSQSSFALSGNMVRRRNASVLPTEWHDGGKAITVGDTVIFFCGWNGGHSPFNTDTCWYSTDGCLTMNYLGKAPWGKIHAFEVIKADDGYWYEIGGDQYVADSIRRSVWRTKTPQIITSWVRMTKTAPFSAIMYEAAAKGDSLYYIGGQLDEHGVVTDTIWVSGNGGANWKFRSKAPAGRIGKNITGCGDWFNGRFYIVSGGLYNVDSANIFKTFGRDVYSTADFENWRSEDSTPVGTNVQYNLTIPWDGKLWRMGGNINADNTNIIIYMTGDGKWHKFKSYDTSTSPVVYAPTHAAATTIWRDRILQVNGNSDNQAWEIVRTNVISNPDGDIKFETPISVDTILTDYSNTKTVFGSRSSSTAPFLNLMEMTGGSYGGVTINRGLTINMGTAPAQPGPVIQGTSQAELRFQYSGGTSGYYIYANSTSLGFYTTASPNVPMFFMKGGSGVTSGQIGIGMSTSAGIASSAVLDLTSTDKGFLPPRMTQTQRNAISSPAVGLVVFNTTTNKLNFWIASAWQEVTSTTAP